MGTANLFVAPAAIAASASNGDYFVEAKGGSASVWSDGLQANSEELLAGYRWNTDFGKLGFELGYMDFGEIDSGTPSNGFALFGATIKGHALETGVDLNYMLAERLYIEPRIGLMRLSYSGVQRDRMNGDQDYDETRTGHYVGIGLGVWITPNFAVSLNFDNHTAEMLGQTQTISVVSVGVQVQF
ncbi:MAG TPA: outer membrane beta-barrel protein [Gammaproteobacteria bacterium]